MAKYCPNIAADMLVRKNVAHGVSRHGIPREMNSLVTSVHSETAHKSAMRGFSRWLLKTRDKKLKHASRDDAKQYLEYRSQHVRQKTLNLDQQAINFHLLCGERVEFQPSKVPTQMIDRAYSREEVILLMNRASRPLATSIALAYCCGLRAMEVMSIAPIGAFQVTERKWHPLLFIGRYHWKSYVVHGKGKLCREVKIDPDMAEILESKRRDGKARLSNRDAKLDSYFDLVSGKKFTDQFSYLTKKVLGSARKPYGPHGLRHGFAQERLLDLMARGLKFEVAMDVLSQEVGHFCQKNTFTYLRPFEKPKKPKEQPKPEVDLESSSSMAIASS